jgi:hypothetical protein
LDVLDNFCGFFPEQEKFGPLLLAVGRVSFGSA